MSRVALWGFANARKGFASGLTLLPVDYLDLGAQRCLGPVKQCFAPEQGSSQVCNWEQMVTAVTEHSGHHQPSSLDMEPSPQRCTIPSPDIFGQ